jgi:hypothetical protein
MTIDWLDLLIVAATSLVAAAVVVTLFSLGVRLTSTPDPRPRVATLGAFVCFGLAGLAVLYGIYLIIPAFHG